MNDDSKKSHSPESSNEAESLKNLMVPKLTWGKFVFLGCVALFLIFSGPFSFFAPIPVAMSFLLYGRTKTFALAGGLVCFGLAMMSVEPEGWWLIFSYTATVAYGFLISRMIYANEKPVFGIIKNGVIVLSLMFIAIGFAHFGSEKGLEHELLVLVKNKATMLHTNLSKSVGVKSEVLRTLEDHIEKPGLLVDQVMSYGVSILIVSVFLSFWVNTFVVLRNGLVWRPLRRYDHGMTEMSKFQMPFWAVWPLIAALVLCVCHAYGILDIWANSLGSNILFSLGLFYLFQGVGILTDLVTYWRIYGFLRTMLVLIAVMTSFQMLALVGVLDTWIDFRRFFNKKNKDEGDTI